MRNTRITPRAAFVATRKSFCTDEDQLASYTSGIVHEYQALRCVYHQYYFTIAREPRLIVRQFCRCGLPQKSDATSRVEELHPCIEAELALRLCD